MEGDNQSPVLTSDNMRKVVEEEGLEARNLVNWNVVVSDKISLDVPKTTKKPPASPRPQSASPRPAVPSKDNGGGGGEAQLRSTNRHSSLGRPKSRLRSSSAGRNPEKCVRARYWAFLFENLYRAVDEIYQTCEVDESIVESKEAIMMLENYCKEFQALIQWLNISKNYEVTPPRNRPTSLAWEVRKSIPTKGSLRNIFWDRLGASNTGARRKLEMTNLTVQSIAVQTFVDNDKTEKESLQHAEVSIDISDPKEERKEAVERKEEETELPSSETIPSATNANEEEIIFKTDTESLDGKVTEIPHEINDVCKEGGKTETEVAVIGEHENILSEGKHSDTESSIESVAVAEAPSKEVSAEKVAETPPKEVSTEKVAEICVVAEVSNEKEKITPKKLAPRPPVSVHFENISSAELEIGSSSTFDVEFLGNDELDDNVTSDQGFSVKDAEEHCDSTETNHVKDSLEASEPQEEVNAIKCESEEKTNGSDVNNTCQDVSIDVNNVCQDTNYIDDSDKVENSNSSPLLEVTSKVTDESKKTQVVPGPKRNKTELNEPLKKTDTGKSNPPTKQQTTVLPLRKSKPTLASSNMLTNKVQAKGPTVTSIQRAKPIVLSTPNLTRRVSTAPNSVKDANEVKRPSTLANKPAVWSFAPNVSRPAVQSSQVAASRRNYQKPVVKTQVSTRPQRSQALQHHVTNLAVKSTSNASANSNLSSKNKKTTDGSQDNAEDSDGWETVRGRTRCKNSPAKTPNVAYDRAVAAKTKLGGFPYTCTSNAATKQKSAPVAAKKTQPAEKGKNQNSTTTLNSKAPNPKEVSKKVSKVNIKPEIAKKVTLTSGVMSSKTKVASSKVSSSSVIKNVSMAIKTSSKSTLAEKQLTVDNMKRKKKLETESSVKMDLQRAHSCGNIETNTKQSNKISQKSVTSDPNINHDSKEESEEKVIVREILKTQESSETIELDKQECLDSDKELSHLHSKKSDLILPLQQCDWASMSDEPDTSQDKDVTDAQTLEMYERMIREEAQEHIAELGKLSWADQMDLLDMELRTPGRALQMHEKLSSPFKKRTLEEVIKQQEEKQLKAQEQREKLLEEKAQHFKDIQKKVEEMRAFNEKRQEQQRISLEQRLQRAEEKRKKELEKIIKKAHDEEEKVNEIAFINSLEAQNKRHDLISKEKDHEARLQDIQEERQRKLEEKAAKEAAAEERRKVLEAERQARVLEIKEKRKQRDLKIEQQQQEKEKERLELANQKARERELRISALNAAQQALAEELHRKIQQKQEESARRHEEQIEQIRQKAFELTVRRYSSNNDDAPKLELYETKKMCTVCNVLIESEVYLLSHLRGKKHQEMITNQHQGHDPSTEELEQYNLKHIVDASIEHLDPNIALDEERLKTLKKRCKKLRQKMANRGTEFERTYLQQPLVLPSKTKQKMLKLVEGIRTYATCNNKGPWDPTVGLELEKTFLDLSKLFAKISPAEKSDFLSSGGVCYCMDLLGKLVTPLANNNSIVPNKSAVIRACKASRIVFNECYDIFVYLLLSNRIIVALETLNQRLKVLIPDNFDKLVKNSSPNFTPPIDEVTGEYMGLLGICLDHLAKRKLNDADFWAAVKFHLDENSEEEYDTRITDIVSYIVSIGIVDRLSQYFSCVRGTVNSEKSVLVFLNQCMALLASVVKLSSDNYICQFDRKKTEDATQLIATLKMTDMVGAVSLLYCILLCNGCPPLGETPPPKLPFHTLELIVSALRLLNYAAVLNLTVLQNTLGSEGISLQLRHIVNYMLWYCKHWDTPHVLNETILLIGYFTAINPDNQLIIQAGQSPSVIAQLSTLPFQYFHNNQMMDVLFPSLIACCYNCDSNTKVLQKEMSTDLLSHYIDTYLLNTYENSLKMDPNARWRLPARFPKFKWTSSKQYFIIPIKS